MGGGGVPERGKLGRTAVPTSGGGHSWPQLWRQRGTRAPMGLTGSRLQRRAEAAPHRAGSRTSPSARSLTPAPPTSRTPRPPTCVSAARRGMEAARPWLSSPGWGSPSGPLRATLCIWASTAWGTAAPSHTHHIPPPLLSCPTSPHPIPIPSPLLHPHPHPFSPPPSPHFPPSPRTVPITPAPPHQLSRLHHWDLCRVASFQGGPGLTWHLLGPLGTPGNRLPEAALLGLSVEERPSVSSTAAGPMARQLPIGREGARGRGLWCALQAGGGAQRETGTKPGPAWTNGCLPSGTAAGPGAPGGWLSGPCLRVKPRLAPSWGWVAVASHVIHKDLANLSAKHSCFGHQHQHGDLRGNRSHSR